MIALQLKDVSYKYPKTERKVLKSINVSFENSKIYVIMGKSGSGKTTLLSLLSGLENPTIGDILLEDKSIKTMNKDLYRSDKVGVIFQAYNLIPSMTAIENVKLALNISKSKNNSKKYAYELLEKVGIDKSTADRKVLKLSGGEQQRVSIARAISNNPSIIIADEPTGNLDEENEEIIMNILSSIAKKDNKCVIIVSHSSTVANYADELWGLSKGQINYIKKK